MKRQRRFSSLLALTVLLAGCVGAPLTPSPSLVSNNSSLIQRLPGELVVSASGIANVAFTAKAPASALVALGWTDRVAAFLVPPAGAAIAGLDDGALANALVKVTDIATGQALATGSADAAGHVSIQQLPANTLVKIEVSGGAGAKPVTVSAVVVTPPEASGSTSLDLGTVGTDNTVAAEFFVPGTFDPKLLQLVDNDVIGLIADLIQLKLDEDFQAGARDRTMFAAQLKEHKSDDEKPKDKDGKAKEEDASTTQDPIRKLISELGLGEGDKVLIQLAKNPAASKTLAGISDAVRRQEVLLKTAFLLQRRDEEESEKDDEAAAALASVPATPPSVFTLTAAQAQGMANAPAHSVGDLVRMMLRIKGMEAFQYAPQGGATQSVDLAASVLDFNRNQKVLEAFKPWKKVNNLTTMDAATSIDSPVAQLLLAFRAAKKSEDALKKAAETLTGTEDSLPKAFRHKALRITSQAEMDALLAAISNP